MIKVTDEMLNAYKEAWAANHCSQRAGLEAVLELIDPVPDGVCTLFTNGGNDEYYRTAEGGNVWRAECGCHYFTFQQIVTADENVSWEGHP